jgi:integrase
MALLQEFRGKAQVLVALAREGEVEVSLRCKVRIAVGVFLDKIVDGIPTVAARVSGRCCRSLPDLSQPYKTSGKVTHRAWFSPEEYQQLYEATRQRAHTPLNNRHRWACEQLHDYVLFMANTGLRPDEARRLEFRDVKVVKDSGSKETILEIEVRGKRGIGWCKSTTRAVLPFTRLQNRERLEVLPESDEEEAVSLGATAKDKPRKAKPGPTDQLFPMKQRGLLNAILEELKLKRDREGNLRTAYSLRHTYICFRLMEGADIYQIAKNCRRRAMR